MYLMVRSFIWDVVLVCEYHSIISIICIWATSWQNQQNDCAPSEDSDSLGIRPVFSAQSDQSLRCALNG